MIHAYPRWHIYTLILLAFIINISFLIVTNRCNFFTGLTAPHGEIGCNLYNSNSIKINPERLDYVEKLQTKEQRLIHFSEINHLSYSSPTQFRNVNDTIGYGILLGLLWKLTHSFSYKDVQWLQVLFFSLLMPFFYITALLFFKIPLCALFCSISLIACFPLIFLNVHPLRDIWAFYGLLLLLYCIACTLCSSLTIKKTILYGVLFALCQLIRPTIFFTLLLLLPLCIIAKKKSTSLCLGIFMACNLFFFWIPFTLYNKYAYGHYFVSCAGQDLYEGLGELQNPWGIQMDDEWFKNYMIKNHQLVHGTIAFHQKAQELFIEAIKQHPYAYLKQILYRVPQLFIFCATMLHNPLEFSHNNNGSSSIIIVVTNLMQTLTGLQKKMYYGRLYLLLGWLGLLLMWYRGYTFIALVVALIAFSSATKIISHLEPRYLMPHYAFLALGIGFILFEFFSYFQRTMNSFIQIFTRKRVVYDL